MTTRLRTVRGWRKLLYLLIVSFAGSGMVTLLMWITYLLYTEFNVWASIFFVGVLVFIFWEVNND